MSILVVLVNLLEKDSDSVGSACSIESISVDQPRVIPVETLVHVIHVTLVHVTRATLVHVIRVVMGLANSIRVPRVLVVGAVGMFAVALDRLPHS